MLTHRRGWCQLSLQEHFSAEIKKIGRGKLIQQIIQRMMQRYRASQHLSGGDMQRIAATVALVGGFCVFAVSQVHGQHTGSHVMLAPSELTWTNLPSLPGVKIAVIEGPLTEAVPIMFRLKFPANYKVPPHWHPGIEHVTVISGTLNMGMGDTFDISKTRALTPGSVAIMPPKTNHFVWTSEETIGQVHSIGPWSVTYVNPADDPRTK